MSPTWPPIGFPPYLSFPMQTTYQKDFKPPPSTAYYQRLPPQHPISSSLIVASYPFAAKTTYQTDFSRPLSPFTTHSNAAKKFTHKKLEKPVEDANKLVASLPVFLPQMPTYIIEKSNKHTPLYPNGKLDFETTYMRDYKAYPPEYYINVLKDRRTDNKHTPLFINGKLDFETTYRRDYKAYSPECYTNALKDRRGDNKPVDYYIDLLSSGPPFIPISYVKSTSDDGKIYLETTYQKSYPAYDPKYYVVSHEWKRLDEESVNYLNDLLPAIGPYNPNQIKSMSENCRIREN